MWFGLDTQIFDWDNKTIKINIDERVAKNQTTDKKKAVTFLSDVLNYWWLKAS